MHFRPIAAPTFKIIDAIADGIRIGKPIKIADLEDAEKENLRRESIAQQREVDDV